MSGFEFARKAGESDEDWAAACRDMARALAKATGTEHLLPNAQGMETREGHDRETGHGAEHDSPVPNGDAPKTSPSERERTKR
jgi:hypothetical protein